MGYSRANVHTLYSKLLHHRDYSCADRCSDQGNNNISFGTLADDVNGEIHKACIAQQLCHLYSMNYFRRSHLISKHIF